MYKSLVQKFFVVKSYVFSLQKHNSIVQQQADMLMLYTKIND